MITNLVLLNGPPRSGKNTVGQLLVSRGWVPMSFAKALKEMTHRAYGLGELRHDFYDDVKDVASKDFRGVTPRQAYIAMSEKFVKPLHGSDYFGRVLAEAMRKYDEAKGDYSVVVTDTGFGDEAMKVVETRQKSWLVRIVRPGYNFKNDSRDYINPCLFTANNVKQFTLVNDSDIDTLESRVNDMVRMIENQRSSII